MPTIGLKSPCGFCCILLAKSLHGLLDMQLSVVKSQVRATNLPDIPITLTKTMLKTPLLWSLSEALKKQEMPELRFPRKT